MPCKISNFQEATTFDSQHVNQIVAESRLAKLGSFHYKEANDLFLLSYTDIHNLDMHSWPIILYLALNNL